MAAFLADHQYDLTLVIEFIRDFWPHDGLVGPDQRAREAAKQIGIFRRLPAVLVFGTSVGIVDADADVFLRRDYRRQHLDVLDLIVLAPRRFRAPLRQWLSAKEFEQPRDWGVVA